ncbi:MAG: AraC family transcriptional regulator [Eubacteriales bacterium]|nr:AraC family transcriptional regulator [Eubacteriales bacterium]
MREQALAVQRMQDYIDANLDREITLNDLAKESLFSPWYSYRLFREYTGLSPAGYIRRLRLSRSALRLRKENLRIIDLAFELGFRSADGYTRAFFREFGCTPKDYAKNPVPIALFIPYGIKFRELRKDRTTIQKHYMEKLTLEAICGSLYLSPQYVCSVFKQQEGITILDYITDYRIAVAKELLLNNRYQINDVMLMVGYNDAKYFVKVFRKKTGVTPSEYRKMFI